MLLVPARAQYDKDHFTRAGIMALNDGKYKEAIDNFNILAMLDTTDHVTYFYRGIAKYNLGDIRGAHRDFDKSVKINPVFTSGYHYRAITYGRFERYDEALGDLERAISLRPGYIGLYFTRGVTYFLSQRFEEAVKDFDKYIRKEPRDPSAFLNRGASHLFLGDTLKALDDYNRAIKLDRFDPEGFVRRGRLYAQQQRYDLAISDLDQAISLDSLNSLAYFNRALLYYEKDNLNEAMADLNRVLELEPGNALTLYNRSLIYARVGELDQALDDMDRVIAINQDNVLAYYNRAAIFLAMEHWEDALDDYSKAIELYPDFAKAYLNRSWVELKLGQTRASRRDYAIAEEKVKEYRARNAAGGASLADTTGTFDRLLALDADFARHDFDNEMLQYRDVDVRLKPLYKFRFSLERDNASVALRTRYENPLVDRFLDRLPVPVSVTSKGLSSQDDPILPGGMTIDSEAMKHFVAALDDLEKKQYSSALNEYSSAIDAPTSDAYEPYYKAFYLMNRAALRSEMIEFISSMESNVQSLSLDEKGRTRARVSDKVVRTYDYSEAIEDLKAAEAILPDIPWIQYGLGNLSVLSSAYIEAIEYYTKAINLYPALADAYFNRGLVLIYLKDKEKGCIDLSRAGELGEEDSYSVIARYCEKDSLQQ